MKKFKSESIFKVGDSVHSLAFGKGVVLSVGDLDVGGGIAVKHPSSKFNERLSFYSMDGKMHENGDQVLFHSNPEVTPAKRKVKKWIWAYTIKKGIYPALVTPQHHSQDEFLEFYQGYNLKNYLRLMWTEIETEE